MVYRDWGFSQPLDPDCPSNPIQAFYDDPMTQAVPSDVISEISNLVEKGHREKCERCQTYGIENGDVIEPW